MINLICLPYAGGTAAVYHRWKPFLDNRIRLCPIELAGRGRRLKEPFYNSFEEAVDDIYGMIGELTEFPYALFGHSMGGALAYELAFKIKYNNQRQPMHIFISGRRPPHVNRDEKLLHLLPFEEFKEEILKLGGTPRELFENKELWDIFLPVLRADYKIIEGYEYKPYNFKLECGLTVLAGELDDESGLRHMTEWQRYSESDYSLHIFDGGHFFIHDYMDEVIRVINHQLTNLCLQ